MSNFDDRIIIPKEEGSRKDFGKTAPFTSKGPEEFSHKAPWRESESSSGEYREPPKEKTSRWKKPKKEKKKKAPKKRGSGFGCGCVFGCLFFFLLLFLGFVWLFWYFFKDNPPEKLWELVLNSQWARDLFHYFQRLLHYVKGFGN